jgi:hypothetical protein
MKNLLLTTLFLYSFTSLIAQRIEFAWNPNPTIHSACNPEYLKESAIILNENVQVEYSYNSKGTPVMTRRLQKLVKVNDEKGIEMYNKIKIGYREENPIKEIKARTILPSGKVIELKPDAFKDLKDEDGSLNKIFAMEGIEKGAEIEYMFVITAPISFFGNNTFQDIVPTCNSHFEILSPKNLIFEVKGYNDVKLAADSVFGNKNSFYSSAQNLPGLEEEKMATYLPHFARIEYSLAYNTEGKGRSIRILNWDDASKNIYANYHSFSEKELKTVGKLVSTNKEYEKCVTTQEKVEWIENFVKSNYIQQEYVASEDAENIDFILKNKITTETGIKLLFSAIFQSQNINYEIGFTTDRFIKPFDYSFPNWDNLKNCVMYFPDFKQFMAPNEITYRLPFIPAKWTANQSLFSKVLKLGDVVTADAEKRKIPPVQADLNYHNHEVEVSFNSSMDTSIIQLKNIFGGYNSIEILPLFIYLDKEKRDEVAKDILRLSEKDEKIENIKYENNEFSSITKKKPLILNATIHSVSNIEKAGNKYLFRVGELIGRQSEMYQEKERKFDLEIANAHQYLRSLKINIPAGYKVNNLDKLNMNVVTMVNNQENCKFTSSYKLNGNVLDITVFEIYHTEFTPLANYEDYRKVINAAADFNKIVLVLEKI